MPLQVSHCESTRTIPFPNGKNRKPNGPVQPIMGLVQVHESMSEQTIPLHTHLHAIRLEKKHWSKNRKIFCQDMED